MIDILIILGKTASGKSTIQKELVNYGFNPLVTYSTRPKRPNEIDGIDYHFITTEEFYKKESEGFFAETTSYNTAHGLWCYGSAIEDITDDKICVLNPSGYWQLLMNQNLDITTVYIDVKKRILKQRLKARGDNKKEYKRRLKADNVDFKGIKKAADYVLDGNSKTPQALAIEIMRLIKVGEDNDTK